MFKMGVVQSGGESFLTRADFLGHDFYTMRPPVTFLSTPILSHQRSSSGIAYHD